MQNRVHFFSDIWIGKQILKERHRIRRIIPYIARAVWVVGNKLMKSFIKNTLPRVSKGKTTITKQYFKHGGYGSAKRDFLRFKPTNVKQFIKPNVSNSK